MGGTFTLDTSGAVDCGLLLCDCGVDCEDRGPGAGCRYLAVERRRNRWSDLSPFVQGYIEAAFESLFPPDDEARAAARAKRGWVCNWTGGHCPRGCASPCSYTTDRSLTGGGVELRDYNRAPAFSDLAPHTLAAILKDCEAFAATFDLARLAGRERDAGQSFWVTRNRIFGGTVAGSFYDDQWNGRLSLDALEGDHLALVAKTFPPLTPSLSDDGKVRMEARS